MRLSTRTDLALRVLMACAINPDRILRRHEIAHRCGASNHHLAQVINRLAHLGYVTTWRGRAGGVSLALPPERIAVGRLFRALESDFALADCFVAVGGRCPLAAHCRFRSALLAAQTAFAEALDGWSLADLCADNAGLTALLRASGAGSSKCAPSRSSAR